MMGALFKKIAGDGAKKFRTYVGDTAFLNAAASAAANITAADGKIEDIEIKKAKKVMGDNPIIKPSFSAFDIEKALDDALDRAESRSGRKQNIAYIEAMREREPADREAIFLIGVDVGDVGDIGEKEELALGKLGEQLGVNAKALLEV